MPRVDLVESLFPGPGEKGAQFRRSFVLREERNGMLEPRGYRMVWRGHRLSLGSKEQEHGPLEPSLVGLHCIESAALASMESIWGC